MYARHVVYRIAHQSLKINHQMRWHAKLCRDTSHITPLTVHGVDDGDVLVDQLAQIFVTARNNYLNALLGRQYSQGANDIIGFYSGHI